MAKFERSLQDMLKDSRDPDIDIRIMGANDLCQYLQDGSNIDQKQQDQICQEFLTHLSYKDSLELRGNAVRCISKVASKLGVEQLKIIVKNVVDKIVKDDPSIRDINSTCVKTIIQEIQGGQTLAFCEMIITQVQQELFQRKNDLDIQSELIDIIDMLFKKFGGILLQSQQIKLAELQSVLVKNLDLSNDLIKKKSSTCLGSLSFLLSNQDLQKLVFDIQGKLQTKLQESRTNERVITYLNTLYSITRYSSHRFKSMIGQILPFFLEQLTIEQQESQDSDFDFHSILIESFLNIIDNILRGCPVECQQYLTDQNQVLDQVTFFLNFDPNGSMGLDDFTQSNNKMEIEGEDDQDYDDYFGYNQGYADEDESWRVRRASIRVVDSILKYQKQIIFDIQNKATINKLKDRLKETDDSIRNDTFAALESYLKAITVQNDSLQQENQQSLSTKLQRQDSEIFNIKLKSGVKQINDLIEDIIQTLVSIIKGENISQTIKQNASQLLTHMCTYIPDQAFNKWSSILELSIEFSKKSKQDQEIFYQLLICLRRIMRLLVDKYYVFSQYFDKILQLAQVSINYDYYKISSQGFKILNSFYQVISFDEQNKQQNFQTFVKGTLPLFQSYLEKQNIDQEIKQSVVSCVTQFLVHFGTFISESEVIQIFKEIQVKLQNDITREQTLKLLWKLPISFQQQVSQKVLDLLNSIIQEIAQFLLRQSRTLRIITFESLANLILILKGKLAQSNQELILNNLQTIISEEDIYIAQRSLELIDVILENNQQCLQQIKGSVPVQKIIEFTKSSLIKGQSQEQLINTYQTLQKFQLIDPLDIIQKLESIVDKNNLSSISGVIARLCINLQNQQVLIKYLNTVNQSNQDNSIQLQLALLIVKELGKGNHLDKNAVDELFKSSLNLLNSKNEDVKNCASLSLGGLTLGQPQVYLNQVLDQIKKQKENYYLLLITLKEIIEESDKLQTQSSLISLIPELFTIGQNSEENIRNLIAECIGKLCIHQYDALQDKLLSNLLSPDVNRRYTAATSFKYFCNHQFQKIGQLQVSQIFTVLCQKLEDVNIDVRRATFISLNSIIYNFPSVSANFDQNLFKVVNKQTQQDKSLVNEISLGLFTHVVDTGLPLRNAVFNFLETCVDSIEQIRPNCLELLTQGVLENGLTDPSDDIQIISFNIINKLSEVRPELMQSEIKHLTDKFTQISQSFYKKIKNIKEGDRSADTLKSFFRCVKKLNKVPEIECQQEFKQFYHQLKQAQEFNTYLNQI